MIVPCYKLDRNIVQSCPAITKIDQITVFFTFYTVIYVDFIYLRKKERYDGEKLGKSSKGPVGSVEAVKGYLNTQYLYFHDMCGRAFYLKDQFCAYEV